MKSAFWRVAALALIVALVPSKAFAAGEVARSSMAGSNFHNTSADSWIFFQRNVGGEGHGEFVSQGYDEDGDPFGEAFGRLILPVGDYMLGFSLNDDVNGSNLVDYSWGGAPYSRALPIGLWEAIYGATGFNSFLAGEMMTVKFGSAAGEGGFSVGGGFYSNSYEDNDADTNDSSTGFSLNGSWGNGAPKTQGTIELAAEFTSHSNKFEDGTTPTNDAELSGNHIGANIRYSLNDDSHFEGAFAWLSSDYDTDAGTDSYGLMGFKVAYARDLVEEADRGAIVEVSIDYTSYSEEPEGAGDVSSSNMMLPGCRFSAWNNVGSHFRIYGGVAGSWNMGSDEDPDDADVFGDIDVDSSYRYDDFYYTAGLGFTPNERISFDIYVITDNISNFLSLHGDENSPIVGGFGATASF